MKQLLRPLMGMLLCLLVSCDYSPSGEHLEKINPSTEVIGDISLNDYQDTILVRGTLNLNFSISLPGRTFYGYRLQLGNTKLAEGGHSEDTFLFQSKKYYNGYHVLKLSVFGSSNTGSLADKAGAEAVEVYRTWIVHIDNSAPSPVHITSIKPEDGQLKIEWQKYKGAGFEKYTIIREYNNEFGGICATITDQNQTAWYDQSYTGGQVTYYMGLYVNGGEGVHFGPKSYHFTPAPRILSSSYNQANDLTITFSTTRFYKNFGKYELSLNNSQPFIRINELQDTVITVPMPEFGSEFKAGIYSYYDTEKINTFGVPAIFTYKDIPGVGTPWGPYDLQTIESRSATDAFYSITPDKIKIIDANTLQVKQERENVYRQYQGKVQTVISPDARFMYAVIDWDLHLLDPVTLETKEKDAYDNIVSGSDYFGIGLGGCSNTNRLAITRADTTYLVDMERKKIIFKKKRELDPHYVSLSPDGKALRIDKLLYIEQLDGSWKLQPLSADDVSTLKFHPVKGLFMVTRGNVIDFYLTSTGAKNSSFLTEETLSECELAAGSGYLYGYTRSYTYTNNHMVHVYSTTTGQLIRKLKIKYNSKVLLYKNVVYSQNRYLTL